MKTGSPSPDIQTVERLLCTDGGPVYEQPGNALKKALWTLQQLSTGTGGTGMRPGIADTRAVQVEQIVLTVHCPDRSTTSASGPIRPYAGRDATMHEAELPTASPP